MTERKARIDIDGRVEEVRQALRRHHAEVQPDAGFAARVMARLPRHETFVFDWAVRRVLPVSVGVAFVLMIAVIVTGARPPNSSVTAPPGASSTSENQSDPLDWLLDSQQERR
jgi:hypothetical protein